MTFSFPISYIFYFVCAFTLGGDRKNRAVARLFVKGGGGGGILSRAEGTTLVGGFWRLQSAIFST